MKTIVWDVDDVLNDLMRAWFHGAWKNEQAGCTVVYEGILENPPHRVLDISSESYLGSLDRFRQRHGAGLIPDPEVMHWFQNHGHRFRHVVLTAVPLRAAGISAEWVMRHFGKWIRSVNIVPSLRADEEIPAYDLTKKDFLSWWGKGDVFVDDNAQTVESALAIGVNAILWPRPWNNSRQKPADILKTLSELAS